MLWFYLQNHFDMTKTIYVIRHCKAQGQEPNAPLTLEGVKQAEELSHALAEVYIEQIVSSPYIRAMQSVEPLAKRLVLDIKLDDRLIERVLCKDALSSWIEHLKRSFHDMDYFLEGGESSRQAMQRIVGVVDEVQLGSAQTTLLVTHGNLMSLLLKHFNNDFGFFDWQGLGNPDVYQIVLSTPPAVARYPTGIL